MKAVFIVGLVLLALTVLDAGSDLVRRRGIRGGATPVVVVSPRRGVGRRLRGVLALVVIAVIAVLWLRSGR